VIPVVFIALSFIADWLARVPVQDLAPRLTSPASSRPAIGSTIAAAATG